MDSEMHGRPDRQTKMIRCDTGASGRRKGVEMDYQRAEDRMNDPVIAVRSGVGGPPRMNQSECSSRAVQRGGTMPS